MEIRKLLLDFIGGIANEIAALSDSDISKLESGKFSLSLKVIKKPSTATSSNTLTDEQIQSLRNKLDECLDRDSGYRIIDESLKNKKQLEAFAKSIEVYVMKQDNVKKLKERIILGTIGARLSSEAIQGKGV